MAEETLSPFSPPKANLEGPVVAGGSVVLAARGARLAAVLLDGLIILPIFVIVGLSLMGLKAGAGAETGGTAPQTSTGFFIGMTIAGVVFLGMVIFQLYLLSTRGQTLGKRWMKIRVVKLDGTNPGFVGAVLLRSFVTGLIAAVPYLGGVYGLVDTLFIFREDRRCIHDLIAGTRVVQV